MKILKAKLFLSVAVSIMAGTISTAGNKELQAGSGDNIAFNMTTDKSEYAIGEPATIRFTVVNRGSTPLYISHYGLGVCGKWTGYMELQLLDEQKKPIPMPGCHGSVMLTPGASLKDVLNNSSSWIILLPREIYGEEETLDLPARAGQFEIKAELRPPAFTEQQIQTLTSQNIRVLRETHVAEKVAVRVH